jgi:hypothetical protein
MSKKTEKDQAKEKEKMLCRTSSALLKAVEIDS